MIEEPAGGAREGWRIERATADDVIALEEAKRAFWGDRDLPALHHVLLVYEFGDTALVVRGDDNSSLLAYAFALLTPAQKLYIHLVAVREDQRGRGLARGLYEELFRIAAARGARRAKAFARPENTASRTFHTRMGFTATDVPNYVGGEMRVVFERDIGIPEGGMSN
jgi:predicted GNAT superfamily acetyltransferase